MSDDLTEYDRIFTDEITPLFCDSFQILLSIPTSITATKKRVPIMLMLSNGAPNAPFGSYIYAIQDPRTKNVYQTVLNELDDNQLDLTKKLANIICKKYNTPTYVNVNGDIPIFQHLNVIKAVIEFIDDKLKEVTNKIL